MKNQLILLATCNLDFDSLPTGQAGAQSTAATCNLQRATTNY